MARNSADFDVGIIGGGPAGAAMGAYLTKAGLNCAILEGALFPRPCVGESLVPATNRTLSDLGLIDRMDDHFVRKHGAAWTAPERDSNLRDSEWKGISASNQAVLHFREFRLEGLDRNHTWHVDRSVFDTLMLQHANSLGAKVLEGVRVKNVELPDDPNSLARIKFGFGPKETDISCRMVVDASGRKTFLGRQMGFKVLDPDFDQYASYGWFEDFDRSVLSDSDDLEDYIFIHFMPLTNTWVWQIPISPSITSIGVVTQKKHFAKSKASREEFFWDCLKARPPVYEAVKQSRQMFPLKDEADYSYAMKQICGDNFVMVGDAARFVDPIFSSGISIAFASVKLASQDILGAFETGNFTQSAFQEFQTRMTWGVRNWYKFITLFYRLNILFTYFVQSKVHRLDVMKLLMGDVYDEEEPPVLAKMREVVRVVEADEDHMWHDSLSDLTADRFSEMSV